MTMNSVKATHINGHVRIALVRSDADVQSTVESLERSGCWKNITVGTFTVKGRR